MCGKCIVSYIHTYCKCIDASFDNISDDRPRYLTNTPRQNVVVHIFKRLITKNIYFGKKNKCRVIWIFIESSTVVYYAGGSGVRLNDGPDIKLFILAGLGRSFFVCCLAHRGSTVGFLLLQCPVVLFATPGISRCRSQHVSVESSSLLHHSIYLWFICFRWWSIDELENLHADRTTVCFEPW